MTDSDVPDTCNYPTANDYKRLDHVAHVYKRPDTYIGSDKKLMREEWLYDVENKQMVNVPIDFVPGCERIYLEVITNASDNVGRSRRAGIDPGKIEVSMSNEIISVTNYGLPIPVEMHEKEKMYVPQLIFGTLLTGSNYDENCHEAGKNGIGSKAANIFSKEFMVIVSDHVRHLKYTQVWNENMSIRGEPIIEKYSGKTSSTQVVYKVDFARFGYQVPVGDQGGYPPEAFALFARHAVDISFTTKATVIFNGIKFDFTDIREYSRLYFGDAVDTAIVHYQWPPGTEVIIKKKGLQVSKNPGIIPEVELIAVDTPDSGYHVSFVNSMMTKEGGVHVNAAVKAVTDNVVSMINDSILKKLLKQSKGKEIDAKERRAHTVVLGDVKSHISVLLSVRVLNPSFTGQTKSYLASPTPKIIIEESELKPIQNWKLIDRLYAALEAKQFASMAKTDGKLRRNIRLKNGTDANNAGKADRHNCVLYIAEGNSASAYATNLAGLIPNGLDYIGILPMRGKLFNVMGKENFQIERNAEITELKKMLGLREGTDYLNPANFNSLRYGSVMIMSDSDVDGKHITGLLLNFFHCRFPSLLARGFLMFYRSPIMRVTHGKNTLKFYTQAEYEKWRDSTPNYKNWKHNYYKGLGSSSEEDVEDDLTTPRIVKCLYDDKAPAAMELAFSKGLADKRKEWIGSWKPSLGIEDIEMQPISWFINHEMILFSIADNDRSLPKLTDGLKESHRKILYGAHKEWKISTRKNEYDPLKVAQFEALVAKVSNYHHGERILGDVIVGMAQDFTSANNIAWFTKDGQFGTRLKGGKDAAETRYSHTKPQSIMAYILREEDAPILEYVSDEGKDVEPETYHPVIPMSLVNGSQGIGTGYSTFIPNHNPVDIIRWLLERLRGTPDEKLPIVLPWFFGFQGLIKVIDRSRRKKRGGKIVMTVMDCSKTGSPKVIEVDDIDEDVTFGEKLETKTGTINDDTGEEECFIDVEEGTPEQRPLLSIVTQGKFHQLASNGTVVVTELPIGRWAHSYKQWLESLREEGKIFDFRNLSSGNKVYFEIQGFKGPVTIKTLKLQRTIGMSNMVLLDESNRPVRYDTTFDILEAFYVRRLPIYQKRKDHILSTITTEIETMNNKVRFITAVINGEIQIIKTKLETVKKVMESLNIPYEIYRDSKTSNFSEDEIVSFKEKIITKTKEYETVEKIPIQQMWIDDLEELSVKYEEYYAVKQEKEDKKEKKFNPKKQR